MTPNSVRLWALTWSKSWSLRSLLVQPSQESRQSSSRSTPIFDLPWDSMRSLWGLWPLSSVASGAFQARHGRALLGMAQHLGVWKLSTEWQDAIAFCVLLIFLVFRPQGFFGLPLRRTAV